MTDWLHRLDIPPPDRPKRSIPADRIEQDDDQQATLFDFADD